MTVWVAHLLHVQAWSSKCDNTESIWQRKGLQLSTVIINDTYKQSWECSIYSVHTTLPSYTMDSSALYVAYFGEVASSIKIN